MPKSQKINKDDILVLYTDGLTEASNVKQEMFGLDNLIKVVAEHTTKNPSNILHNINLSLEDFIKEKEKNDDTTILITKFL